MPGQFLYMKLIISVATIVSLYLSTFNVSFNNHHTSASKFVFLVVFDTLTATRMEESEPRFIGKQHRIIVFNATFNNI